MINEILEYKLFLSENYQDILRKDNLIDGFTGIKHAFLILCRGMIEKCQRAKLSPEDTYFCCIEFLKTWINGSGDVGNFALISKEITADFKKANDNRLELYIESFSEKEKAKICSNGNAKTIGELLKKKLNSYAAPMFSSGEGNEQNRIFFKGVFAEALFLGNLTNKVLALNPAGTDFSYHVVEPNNGTLKLINFHDNRMRIILAITAFYLQNRVGDQKNVSICKADISNYLKIAPSSKGKGKASVAAYTNNCPFIYTKNNQPLFDVIQAGKENNLNSQKLYVNSQWLSDFDIKLLPEKDLPENYLTFDDAQLTQKWKTVNKIRKKRP